MLKRLLSIFLVFLSVNIICDAQRPAGTTPTDIEKETDKVISNVYKIGLNTGTLMKVVLRDGTELTGYINEANQESFVLVNDTGGAITLTYERVKLVKKYTSKRRKIGSIIGYAGFAAIIVAWTVGYAVKK